MRLRQWTGIRTSPFASLISSRWRVLLQAWPHLTRQNDCSELLRYLLDRCRFPALQCTWEARTLSERQGGPLTLVDDSGPNVIMLPIAPEHHTVQDCIDSWHHQPSVHASTGDSSCLMLVLARYSQLELGKNSQCIACHPTTTISVPYFTSGLQVEWRRYRLTAGVFHVGQSPQSGHYHAFAMHAASPHSQSAGLPQVHPHQTSQAAPSGMSDIVTWCFDDWVSAVPCKPDILESIQHNAYILCFQTAFGNS